MKIITLDNLLNQSVRTTWILFTMALLAYSCGEKSQTHIIAHRGAWKTQDLPENSIAALNHAIALGCYGSEFDVHMTKDSIPVVNHDADFMGMDIESTEYAELLAHSLSNGEKIPTLEAYLKEGLKQKGTRLILEIKKAPSGTLRTQELTRRAVAMVKALGGEEQVEYITFDFDSGALASRLSPDAQVAYLNGDKTPLEAKEAGYTGIDYNLKVFQEKPHWIEAAHKEGLTVNVWTVNAEKDMLDLIRKGVDFITTNEPEKLQALLERGI